MLVSAGKGDIKKVSPTHTHTHSHTHYLASDIAVASHLALGTPQQGPTSRQKKERKRFVNSAKIVTELPQRQSVTSTLKKTK